MIPLYQDRHSNVLYVQTMIAYKGRIIPMQPYKGPTMPIETYGDLNAYVALHKYGQTMAKNRFPDVGVSPRDAHSRSEALKFFRGNYVDE